MEKEKQGMEDLLERLEAAELLIAFATVCRKVHSRYAAQVFNYSPVEPGLRFRMIIRPSLFPVYFRWIVRYVYANYRCCWNRIVNEIIFRWRSDKWAANICRYCRGDVSQYYTIIDCNLISSLENTETIRTSIWHTLTMIEYLLQSLVFRAWNYSLLSIVAQS